MKYFLYLIIFFCMSGACMSNSNGNEFPGNSITSDETYSLLSGDSVKAWYAVNEGNEGLKEGFLFLKDGREMLHLACDTSIYMTCNQILGEIYELRDSCLLFLTHNPSGNYGFDLGQPQHVNEQYKVCYLSADSMILEYNKKRQLFTPISIDIVNRNKHTHRDTILIIDN